MDISEKNIVGVAEPTLKMNLQLFAEGEESEPTPQVETQIQTDAQPTDEQPKFEQEPITYQENPTDNVEEELVKPPVKVIQDDDTNHAFAELRREKERLETEQKERDQFYANKYKDYGVNSEADYRKKVQEADEEQRQQEINEKLKTGASYDDIKNIMEEMPEVKQLRQQVKETKVMGIYKSEIDQLTNEFPDLKENFADVKDLNQLKDAFLKLPNGNNVMDKIIKGYSVADAYKVSNWDSVTQQNTAAAKQAALNSVNGRQHLKTDEGGADEINSIPPDIYAEYKRFMPHATDSQIYNHYKNNK